MASALRPPRVPKPKGVLPSHYYESFLEKKGPSDRDYKKFWAGLQGLTIYFYNSNRDFQHVEKLNLGAFEKLTDEIPWGSSHDPGTHFSLILRNQEIKFKVETLECREMWKGFILTVVELRVPTDLTLLPGHLYMMSEVLAKEEARRALETPSTHVVRHYKVKREGPKYVIDVEEPFSCTSLDAVVNYFVSHTKKALVPFLLDEDYEKVLGPAPCTGGPKLLPPASVPVSSQDKLPLLPPLPPLPNQEENYVTPIGDAPAVDYENQDVASSSQPVILKPKKLPKPPAKLPKPPVGLKPEPKVFNDGLARKLPVSSAQPLFPTAGKGSAGSVRGGLPRCVTVQSHRAPHSEAPCLLRFCCFCLEIPNAFEHTVMLHGALHICSWSWVAVRALGMDWGSLSQLQLPVLNPQGWQT
ncbi:signal-transducing adaptor protein 2 isoform X5 [Symphalangus syndactylus]|uniref:signal-transducing adaptor protein 2 isoform X5 n=1 Tax=Symphalangus syndactylus TaxID=9590 RepID=UPI003003AA13